MKISNNLAEKLKVGSRWAFLVGGLTIASLCSHNTYSNIDKENLKHKEYIRQNDSVRYNKLLEKGRSWSEMVFWEREAKAVEDSIKLDSIAKTNYALGMQAVRDSLANVNKK